MIVRLLRATPYQVVQGSTEPPSGGRTEARRSGPNQSQQSRYFRITTIVEQRTAPPTSSLCSQAWAGEELLKVPIQIPRNRPGSIKLLEGGPDGQSLTGQVSPA